MKAELMSRSVWVSSETERLRSVVIGYPDSFVMPEPINAKQRIYHAGHPDRPTRERLRPEFDAFRMTLEACGIEVVRPEPVPGVPDQLTPRDIGFVIDDTFVVAAMATPCRRDEWMGIRSVLDGIGEANILRIPPDAPDIVIEGGDIILDKGVLYVGLSERTTPAGAELLRERFGDRYDVQIIPLSPAADGEDVLHLDCTFVPVGDGHCLIYPGGFREIPDSVRDGYEWIEVSREEQRQLGTNVLNLDRKRVISRDCTTRLNECLRAIGLEVFELQFDETPKSGGAFRCASLPLCRRD